MDEYAYVVNVDAAVVRDGEYLLIERGADEEHASGLLAFPGGKVEDPPDGEDVVAATARREVAEEVGVEVGGVEYVLSNAFVADDGTDCLNVVTLCEYAGGKARVNDPEEVAAVHWLSVEEIREHEDAPEYLDLYVDRVEGLRD